MILQALNQLYDRLPNISPFGYSKQKISYELVLSLDGSWHIGDLRVQEGKKLRQRLMEVPGGSKTSGSGIHPNFMWDNTGFLFGRDNKDKPGRAESCFKLFREQHKSYNQMISLPLLNIFVKFLDAWDPSKCEAISDWENIAGTNFIIRLDGTRQYLHDYPEVKALWAQIISKDENDNNVIGQCLVTGEITAIAEVHRTKIKGVKGTKGEYVLVGYNDEAYESYGKTQSFNGPVGVSAAFKYATALNVLLEDKSLQKIQIGDATTVFWTERDSPIEGFMIGLLEPDDNSSDLSEIRNFLEAVHRGTLPKHIDPEINFYILGLSPNSSRLSIRFWYVSNVGDVMHKIVQHFDDLEIIKRENDPKYPGIQRILRETGRKYKDIPPILSGMFIRSVLEGTLYPDGLLLMLLNRVRGDQTKFKVNSVRAAMIKAILNRKYRFKNEMEVTMSLNKDDTRPAYLCGRLFAVLEKAQMDAIKDIKCTIKDRFWGSASATPIKAFPHLLSLAQYHISKSDYGYITEKRIQEILSNMQGFPPFLSLEEQGLFVIGYYHQRQDFYTSKQETKTI
jgi:CRISPR-associated protein Csd1